MGLASKLAASNAAPIAGGYAAPPPVPSQLKPSAYPGQPQYAAYPGSAAPSTQGQQQPQNLSQQQYPSQQSQGYPPQQQQYGQQQQQGYPPQQPSYGSQASTSGPQDVSAYRQSLERTVQEKGLQTFYPPNSPVIDRIAREASPKINDLCARWRIPKEVGQDVVKLGLFDIILYIDDSGSMQFEENGERIDDLKLVLQRVVYVATLFDTDGISIRFMNTILPQGLGDYVAGQDQIDSIMASVKFSGLTPMGRELKRKVIDGIVLRDARQRTLKKPVLVITITDGQPAGDEPNVNAVFDTVRYAANEMQRTGLSRNAVCFQFAQVGNDIRAREFLGRLDTDPDIGSLVDCTSNFEQEQQEMRNQNPPVDLTPDLWMVKILLGAIDPSYDCKDESRSYRPFGGQLQGQGQYNAPAQQQYGPPGRYQQQQQAGVHGAPLGQQGGGYDQQAQGGYGGPPQYAYAPQQQGYLIQQQSYPSQQQGYLPQQQSYTPQQQGYTPQQQGYPPQQQGYPPPQQGYPPQQQGGHGSAPPPPPRY